MKRLMGSGFLLRDNLKTSVFPKTSHAILGVLLWVTAVWKAEASPYYWLTALPPAPSYGQAEQAVFWSSSNNLPEQSVLLSGAFSSTAKNVRIAPLSGASTAAAAVAASALTVPASSLGNTGIVFMLPKTFPKGPFGYRVEDAGGLALVGSGNLPTIYWTEGLPASSGTTSVALHQVLGNGVEAGGILRVMGRDFPPVCQVRITVGGVTRFYQVSTQNPYSITVPILAAQEVGTGTVQVGSSTSLDATFGPALPITVAPASTMTTSSATPSLNGGGVIDNTVKIQACLDANIPAANSVKYINFPPGKYLISGTLTLHPGQYLLGTGANVTIACTSSTPPTTWITGSSSWGLINMKVTAPLNTASNSSIISSDASHAGHVALYGVALEAANGVSNVQTINLWGPDIQIVNCNLSSPSATGNAGNLLALTKVNGAYIAGNTINGYSQQWNYINASQNVIFENNIVEGATMSLVQGALGQINENIYMGNCKISNILGNDCEAVTIDGGGCNYQGLLSASSGSSMVLKDAPDFYAGGGNNRVPTDCIIAVLAGKGQGQYRFISSFDAVTKTAGISKPWDIIPDTTTSVVVVIGRERHIIFYGNSFKNTGKLQLYGGSEDCEIASNIFENTEGILVKSLQYSGAWQVIVNTNILNNYLHGSFYKPKTDLTYPCDITIEAFATGLIGGTVVRGNVGPTSAGEGFLEFAQGGLSSRLCSFLEEGESAPNDQTAIRNLEALNKMIMCKENTLITSQPTVLGSTINTVTGTFGCKFTVGTRPLTVTQLGRWSVSGVNTHVVGIYNSSGALLASVTAPSGAAKGSFAYGTLATPMILAPNTSYTIESTETSGQEKFYDSTTVVRPGNGIVLDGPVSNHVATVAPNKSYGPLNMVFKPEMPLAQSVSTLGLATNATGGKVGVNFTVGSMPITVNRLGRWVLPGNSASHQLQIFNATTHVQVTGASLTVSTAGANSNNFLWGTLPAPVTLSANTAYYLESSEVIGGDTYSNFSGTVLNPGAGVVINSAESAALPAGSVNNSYGPLNLLFEVQ